MSKYTDILVDLESESKDFQHLFQELTSHIRYSNKDYLVMSTDEDNIITQLIEKGFGVEYVEQTDQYKVTWK